jgi:hypothetical protein
MMDPPDRAAAVDQGNFQPQTRTVRLSVSSGIHGFGSGLSIERIGLPLFNQSPMG